MELVQAFIISKIHWLKPIQQAGGIQKNWQTHYHIESWKAISERTFVWGLFVWNMFDFGAAQRTEGDRPGINDKGLVRSVKINYLQ